MFIIIRLFFIILFIAAIFGFVSWETFGWYMTKFFYIVISFVMLMIAVGFFGPLILHVIKKIMGIFKEKKN
jgi:hypothetical protein